MSNNRFWRAIRRRGFRVSSDLVMLVVIGVPLGAILVEPLESWAQALIITGSGMLGVSFHYTSAGNTAYSVAIPMKDQEMFVKAHEITVGAGIMATAAGLLVLEGVVATWIPIATPLWRAAFAMATLLCVLIFYRGLVHIRRFIAWAEIPSEPSPALLPVPDRPTSGDIAAGRTWSYVILSFLAGLLLSSVIKRQK